jgi:hypothetical protein
VIPRGPARALVSKPLALGVASGSGQNIFVLDNAFALIDEYIRADQHATLNFRLQNGGGPYIPYRRLERNRRRRGRSIVR